MEIEIQVWTEAFLWAEELKALLGVKGVLDHVLGQSWYVQVSLGHVSSRIVHLVQEDQPLLVSLVVGVVVDQPLLVSLVVMVVVMIVQDLFQAMVVHVAGVLHELVGVVGVP